MWSWNMWKLNENTRKYISRRNMSRREMSVAENIFSWREKSSLHGLWNGLSGWRISYQRNNSINEEKPGTAKTRKSGRKAAGEGGGSETWKYLPKPRKNSRKRIWKKTCGVINVWRPRLAKSREGVKRRRRKRWRRNSHLKKRRRRRRERWHRGENGRRRLKERLRSLRRAKSRKSRNVAKTPKRHLGYVETCERNGETGAAPAAKTSALK